MSNYALEDLLAFDDIFLDFFNNFLKNPVTESDFCSQFSISTFCYVIFLFAKKAFPQAIQYNRYVGVFEEIRLFRDAQPKDSTQSNGGAPSDDEPLVQIDRLPKNISFAPTLFSSSSDDLSKQQQQQQQQQHQSSQQRSHKVKPQRSSANVSDSEHNRTFDWVKSERVPLFFRTDMFREFKLCKLLTRPLDDDTSGQPGADTAQDEVGGAQSVESSQLIGGYSRQSRTYRIVLLSRKNTNERLILDIHNFIFV